MEKKVAILQFAIGLVSAISGAIIIFHGSLFGENNSGIAIILGIIGICLISTSPIGLLKKQLK